MSKIVNMYKMTPDGVLESQEPPIDWQARCEQAGALNKRWNIAASLSYAGSEFIDDPERIFARVRETQSVQMHALCEEKRRLTTALKSLQEQEDACEQAERERDALVVMLRANVTDATFETLRVIDSVAKYRAMEAELAAIKGRLEWGTKSRVATVCRASEKSARDAVAEFGILRLVSRYSCGPWEPQPCQQCGGEGGGWIDGPGSVFIKCGACGGKKSPSGPSVEVPK